jgi:hypothetical protein
MTSTTGPESPGAAVKVAGRYWFRLIVAVAIAILAAIYTIGGVIGALGADHTKNGNRTAALVFAIISAIVLVACVRWACHLEHRIRARMPQSPASVASTLATPTLFHVRIRRRRPYSPVMVVVQEITLLVGFILCVVGTVVGHGEWVRSQYVQHHGLSESGVVQSVRNIKHVSRSSTWYTSDVTVRLNQPVDGVDVTLAHFPHRSSLHVEDSARVLVDPRQPGYAEFAHYPATPASTWVLIGLFGLALAGAEIAVTLSAVHHYRRKRQHAAAGALTTSLATGI